jgi:hypothetical protein
MPADNRANDIRSLEHARCRSSPVDHRRAACRACRVEDAVRSQPKLHPIARTNSSSRPPGSRQTQKATDSPLKSVNCMSSQPSHSFAPMPLLPRPRCGYSDKSVTRLFICRRSESVNGNSAHRPKGTEGGEQLSNGRSSRINSFRSWRAHPSQESLVSRI